MELIDGGDANNIILPGQEGTLNPETGINEIEGTEEVVTAGEPAKAASEDPFAPKGSITSDEINKVVQDKAYKDVRFGGDIPVNTGIKVGEYDFSPKLSDNNDIARGERQSLGAKAGLGLARLVGTAATKTGSGVGSIQAIPAAVAQWSLDPILNNSTSEFFNNVEEELKEALPIYKGQKYTEGDWAEQMATMDFIADDGMDAVAFLASSYAQGAGMGAIAKGVGTGLARAGAAQAFKNALTAAKLGKGITNARIAKLANSLTTAGITTVNSTVEAAAEARELKERMNTLFEDRVHRGEMTQEEAELKSNEAAYENFWTNIGILMPSNFLETKMLFKPFFKASDEVAGGLAASARAARGVKPTKWQNVWQFGKSAVASSASEGMWEEGMQTASQNYSEAKALGETDLGYWDGLTQNWLEGWSTDEGRQSMAMGAIIGLIPGGVGGLRDSKADAKAKQNAIMANGAYIEMAAAANPASVYQTKKVYNDDGTVTDTGVIVLDDSNNPVYDMNKVRGIFNMQHANGYENFLNAQAAQEAGDEHMYNFARQRNFSNNYFFSKLQNVSPEAVVQAMELSAKEEIEALERLGLQPELTEEQRSEKVTELLDGYKEMIPKLDKVMESINEHYADALDFSDTTVDNEKAALYRNALKHEQFGLAADQIYLTELESQLQETVDAGEQVDSTVMEGVEGMLDNESIQAREEAKAAINNLRRTKEALRNNRSRMSELLDNAKQKQEIVEGIQESEELDGTNIADADASTEQEANDPTKNGGNPTRKKNGQKKAARLNPSLEMEKVTPQLAEQNGFEVDEERTKVTNSRFNSDGPAYYHRFDKDTGIVDIIETDGTPEGNVIGFQQRKAVSLKDEQGGEHRATLHFLDGELKGIVTRDMELGSKGNVPISVVREKLGKEEITEYDIEKVVEAIEDLTMLTGAETVDLAEHDSIDFAQTVADLYSKVELANKSLFENLSKRILNDEEIGKLILSEAEEIRKVLESSTPLSLDLIEALYKNDTFDSASVSSVFNTGKEVVLDTIYQGKEGILKVEGESILFTDREGVVQTVTNKTNNDTFSTLGVKVLNQTAADVTIDYDYHKDFYINLYGVAVRPASHYNPVDSIEYNEDGTVKRVILEVQGTGRNIEITNNAIANDIANLILSQEIILNELISDITRGNDNSALMVEDFETGANYAVFKGQDGYAFYRKNAQGKFVKSKPNKAVTNRVLGTYRQQLMHIADSSIGGAIKDLKNEIRKNGRGIGLPTTGEVFNLPNESEVEFIKQRPEKEISQNDRRAGQSLEQSILDELSLRAAENIDIETLTREEVEEEIEETDGSDEPIIIPEKQSEYDTDSGYGGVSDPSTAISYSHRELGEFDADGNKLRDTFVVRNLEFMRHIMNEGVSPTAVFEFLVDTDYTLFWDEFPEMRNLVVSGKATEADINNFLKQEVPDNLKDSRGRDGSYTTVLDKLPIKTVFTDQGSTFSEGMFLHEAGFDTISIPRKLYSIKDAAKRNAAIAKYKEDFKRKSRENRRSIAKNILFGNMTTARPDANNPVSTGSPTNSGERGSITDLAAELGIEVNDINIAVQTSTGEVKVQGFKTDRRVTTRGGVYWGHNFTANGKPVITALNKNKLSEAHAEVILDAFIQANNGKNLKDLYEGSNVEGDMSILDILNLLVTFGKDRLPSDSIKAENEELYNNMMAQALYSSKSKGKLYFGASGEINIKNPTKAERQEFIQWATTTKNYMISGKYVTEGFTRSIKNKNKGNTVRIGDMTFDPATDSYKNTILSNGYLNTTAEVVPGTKSITNSPTVSIDFSTVTTEASESSKLNEENATTFKTYAAYLNAARRELVDRYQKQEGTFNASDYPNLSENTRKLVSEDSKLTISSVKEIADLIYKGTELSQKEKELVNDPANKPNIDQELLSLRTVEERAKVGDRLLDSVAKLKAFRNSKGLKQFLASMPDSEAIQFASVIDNILHNSTPTKETLTIAPISQLEAAINSVQSTYEAMSAAVEQFEKDNTGVIVDPFVAYDNEGDLTDASFDSLSKFLGNYIKQASKETGIPLRPLLKYFHVNINNEYFSSITPILDLGKSINYTEFIKLLKDIAVQMNPERSDQAIEFINDFSDENLNALEAGEAKEVPKEVAQIFETVLKIGEDFQDVIKQPSDEIQDLTFMQDPRVPKIVSRLSKDRTYTKEVKAIEENDSLSPSEKAAQIEQAKYKAIKRRLDKLDNAKRDENGNLIDPHAPLGGPNSESKSEKVNKDYSIERASKWLRDTLGQDFEIETIDKLVELGGNRHLMGQARVDAISLYHQAEEGTEYHEAFHRVSLFYLSDDQRNNFYKAAREQFPELENATDQVVEEHLAEQFRDYVSQKKANRPTTMFGKIKDYLQKIWHNIRRIFTGPGRLDNIGLEQLYDKIESGRFKHSTVDPINKVLLEGKYANLEIGGRKFDYIQSEEERAEVVKNLFFLMTSKSGLVSENQEGTELKFSNLDDIENLSMDNLRLAIEEKIDHLENEILEGNLPEGMEDAYDNTLSMLQEVQDNFQYIKDDLIDFLEDLNIQIDPTDRTDHNEETEETGDAKVRGEIFGKESFQYSAQDSVANNVKMLFSILPKSTGKTKFAGLSVFQDFGTMWVDILNNSDAILTATQMMGMLKRMSNGNVAYKALHQLLSQDPALQVQVLNVVKQTKINFLSAFIEKVGKGINAYFGASYKAARDSLARDWNGTLLRNEKLFIPMRGEPNAPSADGFAEIAYDFNELDINVREDYEDGVTENFEDQVNEIVRLFKEIGIVTNRENLLKVVNEEDPMDQSRALYEFVHNRMRYIFGPDSDLHKLFTGGKVKSGITFSNLYSKSPNFIKLTDDLVRTDPELQGLSIYGPGGNLYYIVTQHNALTETVDTMKNDVVKYMDEVLQGVYNKNSLYANYFKENPEAFEKFGLSTLSSVTEKGVGDVGREYQKITDMEEYILRLTANAKGYATLPTPGERKYYQYFSGVPKTRVNMTTDGMITVDAVGSEVVVDAMDTLVGYYADDVNRAFLTRKQVEDVINEYGPKGIESEDTLLPSELIENIHYKHNGDRVVKPGQVVLGTVVDEDGSRNWAIIKPGKKAVNGDGKLLMAKGDYVGNGAHLNLFKGLEVPSELVTSENRAQVEEMIQNIVKERLQEELALAESYGIIVKKEGYYNNSLIPSEIYEQYFEETNNHPQAVENAIADFMINNMIANVEFTKVFSADPAGFKSDTDVIKRVIGYTATGNSLIHDYPSNVYPDDRLITSPNYNTALINSYEHVSSMYKDLVKFHSEYYYNNILDSNGNKIYTLDEAVKVAEEMLSGMLSNDQTDGQTFITAEMYRALAIKLEEWSPSKEEGYQLLKQQEAGEELTRGEEMKVAKAIMQPLKMLYMRTERVNGQSYSVFDKMSLATLYRPMYKGTEIEDLIDRMESKGEYKGMTPIDQIKFTTATKSGKGNTMNYYDNAETETLADFGYLTPYAQQFNGLRKQLVTDPHDSSSMAVGVQMLKVGMSNVSKTATYDMVDGSESKKGSQVTREVNDLISELSLRGLDKVRKNMGLDENFIIKDFAPIIATLKEDAKTGKLPRFVIDSFKEDENGRFYIEPDAMIGNNKWIQSRIISSIKRDTTKVYFPGNHFIQVSNIGYHTPNSGAKKKLRWDNGEGYIEAAVSLDFVKQMVDGYQDMTEKEIIDQINLKDLPAMAYRVPTQGQNSTFALKVVEILPANTGHTIILPAEGPSVAGYDYDIDKLYVIRHNYDNGKKIAYDHSKGIKGNSEQAIQNRLLDTYISIWLNEHHKAHRTRPLGYGTEQLKKQAARIRGLKGVQQETSSPLKTATPSYQIAVKSRLKFSNAGIGPSALANTFIMLAQSIDVGLNTNLGYGTTSMVNGEELTTFSDLLGTDLQYKTEWFSALLDGFIDAGSDPFIYDLNANDYTLPTATLMLMSGIGGIKTFDFLAQPILEEVARSQENRDNAVGLDLRGVIDDIESSYNKEYTRLSGNKYVPETLQNTFRMVMEDANEDFNNSFKEFGDYKNGVPYTAKYYKHQLDVLRAFKYADNYAGNLKDAILAARADSGKFGSTVGEVTQYEVRYNKARENSSRANGVRNFDRMMDETFMGSLTDNSVGSIQMVLGQIMIEGTPGFINLRDALIASTGFKYSASNALVDALSAEIQVNIASRFFTDILGVDESTISELMYGKDSLPNRLFDIRAGDTELADNSLIKSLIPHNEQDRPHLISFKKPDNKLIKDSMNRAWTDIYAKDRKLAMDIFKFSYLNSGFKTGVYSFFDLVPRQALLDTGYNTYIKQAMEFSSVEAGTFLSMFDEVFMNSWNNDRIVPVVDVYAEADAYYEGTFITFPVNNERLTVGENKEGLVLGKPYIKDGKGDDARLYKNIGYNEAMHTLVYMQVPKKSYYGQGFVVRENNIKNSRAAVNNNIANDIDITNPGYYTTYVDTNDGTFYFPDLKDTQIFEAHSVYRSYDAYDGASETGYDKGTTEETVGESLSETTALNLANVEGFTQESILEIENAAEGDGFATISGEVVEGLYTLPSDGTVVDIRLAEGDTYSVTKMLGHTPTTEETNNTIDKC